MPSCSWLSSITRASCKLRLVSDISARSDAALRVFGNAEGAYGANVNHLIDCSRWDDEDELAETYTSRKGFAYGISGRPVSQPKLLQSVLAKVELRKGDALYLNEGSYGTMFDAAHAKWPFPVKMMGRKDDEAHAVERPLLPYRVDGPTCDSIDHMPGPFWLPEDVREGDYIEIGMLGAYGAAMKTAFNGFGQAQAIGATDEPMASLYRGDRADPRQSDNVVSLR